MTQPTADRAGPMTGFGARGAFLHRSPSHGEAAMYTNDLYAQLKHECGVMASFALETGKALPPSVIEGLGRLREAPETADNLRVLTEIHNNLSEIVAPACAKTIEVCEGPEGGDKTLLGRVKRVGLLTGMAATTLAALVGFITISGICFYVGVEGDSSDHPLMALKLIFAAALGAGFSQLSLLNQYVKNSTYDPRYASTYVVRFFLGVVAGAILAMLVPFGDAPDAEGIGGYFEKPLVALLGGYAATAVNRLLDRLVSALESLVRGDTQQQLQAREQELAAKLAKKVGEARLTTATDLIRLRDALAQNTSSDQLNVKIDEMINGLLGEPLRFTRNGSSSADQPAAAPGRPATAANAPPLPDSPDKDGARGLAAAGSSRPPAAG